MRSYILYVKPTISTKEIKQIENLLEGIRTKHKISYKIIDGSRLNREEIEELTETIRRISRKKRIRVRSGGGGILPISRSGAVNLGNIPILLVLEDERPMHVYPHEAGVKGQRFEVLQHLNTLLKADHLDELRAEEVLSEQDISKMISNYPALIEEELEFLDTEVAVKGAQIDMVFKDKTSKHVLIEIELKVTDAAIGQVIKFLNPYSQKFRISPKNIRRALVCVDISENHINTCKTEGIEVYKFTVLKLT
ncbi:MAG: endonuclease NucS domain-containing protein [Candidatus Heimdallarchaeota archaeon]